MHYVCNVPESCTCFNYKRTPTQTVLMELFTFNVLALALVKSYNETISLLFLSTLFPMAPYVYKMLEETEILTTV